MKLVLLPGLDGTGELFAPFVAALDGTAAQVVRYPADRSMDYAEHEAAARSQLPQDDFVLLAESFSCRVGSCRARFRASLCLIPDTNLTAHGRGA